MGQLQLNLLLTLAQWERDVRAEGFEAAKVRAVKRGVHVGPAPVGYRRSAEGEVARGRREEGEGGARGVASFAPAERATAT